MKYRQVGEDFREAMNRIAFGLKDSDAHYHAFREILLSMRFMPGGRIQSAIGSTRFVTAFNCYLSGTISDSYVDGPGSIMQRAHEAAGTMRMGGGIGYDFSTLRPRNDPIRKLQSISSGPCSFIRIYNEVGLATCSAGHRRGAQMGVLRVDHPDITEYIRLKQNPTELTGFNLSIAVTDEFMDAALSDKPFELRFNETPYREINAADLWEMIMRSTWDWGEPGVIFIDRVNQLNNLWYCETIAATNPCFAAGTLITTDKGAFPIEQLVGKTTNIWNGLSWQSVDNFRITGHDQKMLKITLHDGSSVRTTEAHTFILEDGSRLRADQLRVGHYLALSNVEYDGEIDVEGAYIKGFLVGDGSLKRDREPKLYLYEPKYVCRERLLTSASEISHVDVRTNAIENLGFMHQNTGRQQRLSMSGLPPRARDLRPWCQEYKDHLPDEIFRWNRRSKCEFIAGVFDSDGTVMDSSNGFGYQISSISQNFLCDLQTLLKSIGVRSKISLSHLSGSKSLPGGTYQVKDLWRLTISQAASVRLAEQVTFSRLISHAQRVLKYKVASRAGKIVEITPDGIDELVYCCTVNNRHSVALGIGIVTGQCGEQPLPPFGACLLGSFNLTRYLTSQPGPREANKPNWALDLDQLKSDIPFVVRAMDNVIDRTRYPLSEQRAEAITKRRMGLGITGLANALEAAGKPYGTKEFLDSEDEILSLIATESYRASAELAKEKGPFPLFDAERYLEGEFVRTLPDDVRDLISKHGIRNSHLTSQAPTGTISLCADNISSSIEPLFRHRYSRPIFTPDGVSTENLEDYGVAFLGTLGRESDEISASEHLGVLVTAQSRTDSAVSKTVNMDGSKMPWDEFKSIYRFAWEHGAKSCTTMNSSGKRAGLFQVETKEEPALPTSACSIDPLTGRMECA